MRFGASPAGPTMSWRMAGLFGLWAALGGLSALRPPQHNCAPDSVPLAVCVPRT